MGFDLHIKRIALLLWGTKKGSRRRFRRYHLGPGKRADQMVGFGRWILRADSGSIFLVSLIRQMCEAAKNRDFVLRRWRESRGPWV